MSTLTTLHNNYYRDKQVVVTGGAGFIGSHLVDRLVAYGAHVTVLDNLSTGSIDNVSQSAQHISFMPGSITSKALCQMVTKNKSHLFHLAAMVSVAQSCEQPERCHQVNVEGTKLLYEAAAANGVQHIVFASSAAVYGPRDTACIETDQLAPTSPYATSKQAGEQLGIALAEQAPVSVANLRFFNVHGPRQAARSPYSGVVAAFSNRLQKGTPLTVHGDGSQTRDFVEVNEVVTAMLHAGLCTPLRGQAINVASGTSITLTQLIDDLEKKFSCKAVEVVHEALRPGDVTHSAADITRLQRLLAYRPAK